MSPTRIAERYQIMETMMRMFTVNERYGCSLSPEDLIYTTICRLGMDGIYASKDNTIAVLEELLIPREEERIWE